MPITTRRGNTCSMLHERAFVCQVSAATGTFWAQHCGTGRRLLEPAADDALTREIEALRERLVGLGRALARERESQAETGRELAALRQTLAALAELDRAELHVGFGRTAGPAPD